MTIQTDYAVWCDGRTYECHIWTGQHEKSRGAARKVAKKLNWTRRRRDGQLVDLCPVCSQPYQLVVTAEIVITP